MLLSPGSAGEQGGRLGLADFVEIIRKNGVQEELVSDEQAELVFSQHASMGAAGRLNFLSLPALVHELLRGQSEAIEEGGREGKGQEAGGSSCASEVSARLPQGSRRNFFYDYPVTISQMQKELHEHVLRGLQETAGKKQQAKRKRKRDARNSRKQQAKRKRKRDRSLTR